MSSKRRDGAVLVARKGGEYWFIDSVFWHDADLHGCTGMCVFPVSGDQADKMLQPDNMADRYGDVWAEQIESCVRQDCPNCEGVADDDGCNDCGYQSLRDFCIEVANQYGIEAVIDYAGQEYVDALNDLDEFEEEAEYADCVGCGGIFGHTSLDKFDEVYNRKALVACLAYEDGAVDYDYACRVIYGG